MKVARCIRLLCMDFGCHLATRWSHFRVCFIPMGTGPVLDPVYWGRKKRTEYKVAYDTFIMLIYKRKMPHPI